MKQPYIETGSGPVDVTIAHGEPILAIECDCPSDAGQVLTITQLKRWGTDFKTLGKDVDAELAVADSVLLEVPGVRMLRFTPSNASAEYTVRVYPE